MACIFGQKYTMNKAVSSFFLLKKEKIRIEISFGLSIVRSKVNIIYWEIPIEWYLCRFCVTFWSLFLEALFYVTIYKQLMNKKSENVAIIFFSDGKSSRCCKRVLYQFRLKPQWTMMMIYCSHHKRRRASMINGKINASTYISDAY